MARDHRPGQLAERMTHGALRRGVCCGGVRGSAAGSGPRRCAIALEEAALLEAVRAQQPSGPRLVAFFA